MKVRAYVIILMSCLLFLTLSSCDSSKASEVDVSAKDGISFFYSENEPNAAVNLITKKIHMNIKCPHAVQTDRSYYDVAPYSYVDSLVESGYTFCKICSPSFSENKKSP